MCTFLGAPFDRNKRVFFSEFAIILNNWLSKRDNIKCTALQPHLGKRNKITEHFAKKVAHNITWRSALRILTIAHYALKH